MNDLDATPEPTRPIIFLDMDGVCCDFANAANQLCAIHTGKPLRPVETWSFFDAYEITPEQFWKMTEGEYFWETLDAYDHFQPMFDRLQEQGEVYLLSSPSLSPACMSGKLKWIQERLGRDWRRFIFTQHKELLAGPDRVLIDDSEPNCDLFTEHGGRAIVFPQPWNSRRDEWFMDTFSITEE